MKNKVKVNTEKSTANQAALEQYAIKLTTKARKTSAALRALPHKKRQTVLRSVAKKLVESKSKILKANAKDIEHGKLSGLSPAMLDRLTLNSKRIDSIAKSVKQIAAFPDPVGKKIETKTLPGNMSLQRVSVPIGSILFIFESRPNVTIDGGALCFKSGNAVILRGGKEAAETNEIFAKVFRLALKEEGVSQDAVQLVNTSDRALVPYLVTQTDTLDLVIPRGGEKLIESVVAMSKVPVIKHYKGVCHVFVEKTAPLKRAISIALNAKVQRPGVCNAMETLLLDEALQSDAKKSICQSLISAGVQLKVDRLTLSLFSKAEQKNFKENIQLAKKSDWDEEYLDLRLAVKIVHGVQGAIEHIGEHGSGHTDAILTNNKKIADTFVQAVDSSSVMVNASTRFADGGEYGLGAEVGISTDKLHARGPMGIESLTTYKWVLQGKGNIRE